MKKTFRAILLMMTAIVLMGGCEFMGESKKKIVPYGTQTPVAGSDASLKSLGVENFAISPFFEANTTDYSIVVKKSETSAVTVNAIGPEGAAITAAINGGTAVVVSSDTNYSATMTLNNTLDSNTIVVAVTSEDGAATKEYTVRVYYYGTSASLSGLTVALTSGAAGAITSELSPVFASSTYSYAVGISYAVTSIDITLSLPGGSGMTALVDGWTATSGIAVPITNLPAAGGSRSITVEVISQDGHTTKNYTVSITKGAAPSANNLLATLKLYNNRRIAGIEWGWYLEALTPTPSAANLAIMTAFNAQFTSSQPIHFKVEFTTVSAAVYSVKVNGAAVSPSGGVYTSPVLTGPGSGDFFIDIEVTAEDGTTKRTYRVTASVL